MAVLCARTTQGAVCQGFTRGHPLRVAPVPCPRGWNLLHQVQHQPARSIIPAAQQGGGLGDEEGVDVAVFRFTLGIPGFEDRFIPRVVGAVGAALLVINHFLGAQPAPDAQVRAEYLVLALSVLGVIVPEIEERLKEALPGRGRQRMAEKIDGAVNGFILKASLSDTIKQELAWSSVSLIKNTNSCGVLVVHDGEVVMARGALSSAVVNAQDSQATLKAMTQELAPAMSNKEVAEVLQKCQQSSTSSQEPVAVPQQHQCYLQDRSAMDRVQAGAWRSLPQGAQSLLLQALPSKAGTKPSYMLVYSEKARSLSDKERKWAAAIAGKLALVLSS